jgi:hypothetical protein
MDLYSSGEDISLLLWNTMVGYCIYKGPPMTEFSTCPQQDNIYLIIALPSNLRAHNLHVFRLKISYGFLSHACYFSRTRDLNGDSMFPYFNIFINEACHILQFCVCAKRARGHWLSFILLQSIIRYTVKNMYL